MDIKVIFHIDENQKWNLLINNVKNLLSSYEGELSNSTIEILANSEAVKGYVDGNPYTDSIVMEALSQKGIKLVACNNALLGMKIQKDQIYHFVAIVPAGVRELVDRQAEGYAYIKP